MNVLFTGDTTLFRLFVPVNRNFSMSDVLPTLNQTALTELPRFLGDALSEQLTSLTTLNPDQPTEQETVLLRALFFTRSFVGKLGFAAHLIFAEVQIDNDGITVSASEGRRPAFDYQTNELKRSLQEMGWQALDDLLKLIGKYPDLFPSWPDSPYYSQYQNALFGSPAEFSKYYPIQDRWLTYWALMPFIEAVGERLGEKALDRIEALPDSVSDGAKTKLRRSLLRALAYEVILQGIPSLSVEIKGTTIQLNYASQYGGKESYYTPPGREMLDWIKENLGAQLRVFWDTFDSSITPLEPAQSTDADLALGGPFDSDGSFVMI